MIINDLKEKKQVYTMINIFHYFKFVQIFIIILYMYNILLTDIYIQKYINYFINLNKVLSFLNKNVSR